MESNCSIYEPLDENPGLNCWHKTFASMCCCLASKPYTDWEASVTNFTARSTLWEFAKKYKIMEKNISWGNFWCYFATFTALFFLQFQNRPTLLCIYNFTTHFRFNKREPLSTTYLCLPVYLGASSNHFVYTAGTSDSVKSQYATLPHTPYLQV